ncbi:hypothetical protein [Pseudoxanthomonas beigongshangi]
MGADTKTVDVLAVLDVLDAAIYERGVSAAMIAEARGMVSDSQLDECDRRLALLTDVRTDEARKLHGARVAISELLDKANLCAMAATPADDSTNDGLYVVRARYVHELRAALRACGGAQ